MFKKTNEMTMKEAIELYLQALKIKDKFSETDIINSWEQIMGAVVSNRTKNIVIKNKILYVTLTSAPLRQELMLMRPKIIEKINQHAGFHFIKDAVFL